MEVLLSKILADVEANAVSTDIVSKVKCVHGAHILLAFHASYLCKVVTSSKNYLLRHVCTCSLKMQCRQSSRWLLHKRAVLTRRQWSYITSLVDRIRILTCDCCVVKLLHGQKSKPAKSWMYSDGLGRFRLKEIELYHKRWNTDLLIVCIPICLAYGALGTRLSRPEAIKW